MKHLSVLSLLIAFHLFSFSQGISTQFARFDHTDGASDYYSIKLSMLNSRSERGYFYEMARVSNVYMVDKEDINSDSALFITGNLDKDMMLSHLGSEEHTSELQSR